MVTPCTVMLVGRMYTDRSREEVCGALRTVDSVTDVRADLCLGTVQVWHEDRCDPSTLLHTLARAGYAPSLLVDPYDEPPGRAEYGEDAGVPGSPPGRNAGP